jgi:hydroxymethylpyrimidine pyrophosphatase-like HAD family hydrolase
MKNIKLVATDLDGTFLKNDRTVSAANIDALHKLGEKQIVRVAATGRIMWFFRRVQAFTTGKKRN